MSMAATLGDEAAQTPTYSCYESCFTASEVLLLFQRVVVDVEIGPGGCLQPRPGATWRSEPARGEATIHRGLTALVDQPDARIAAFASAHGLLRRHVGGVLGASGPTSAAATMAIGQEGVDDSERVQDWLDRGAIGAPPPGTEDTVLLVELYAALPDSMLDTFDSFMDGAEAPTSTVPSDLYRVVVPVLIVTRKAIAQYSPDPRRLRQLDPGRVRRALRLSDWVHRVVGGLDDVPEPLAAVGGSDAFLRQLTTNLPEIFIAPELLDGPDGLANEYLHALATETVDDWHAAARDLGARVRAVDLVRGALQPEGISRTDKGELASLYAELADYRSPLDLAAAEIADRVRPLLARSIESELAGLDSWPIRRGGLVGLYPRALVAAWTELTEASPPKACATPGCTGTVPPTRNRLYCDSCRASRRRDQAQRIRAGDTSPGGTENPSTGSRA